MRVVVGLLPKLYLYPQLLLVLGVQLVLLLLVIAFVLVINNRIILQYGNVYCNTLPTGATIIKFPIAFTTSKPVIFAMPECNSTASYISREQLYAKNATSFTYWNVSNAWLHYKWFCIGY